MACTNYESISDLIEDMDTCTVKGLRADIARILLNICENDINGTPPNQHNRNISFVDLVENTETQYDLSQTTTNENPSGSLVGDSIVIQTTGMHRITYSAQMNTSVAGELRYISVRKNGVENQHTTLTDNGSSQSLAEVEVYRRFDAGDVLTVFGLSFNGVLNSGIVFEVEFLTTS